MDSTIKPHRRLRTSGIAAFIVMTIFASAAPAKAIYNGYDAPFTSYRFMVSLRLAGAPNAHICGGTLIAPDIVLTAAHCTKGNKLVAVVGRDTSDWARAPRIAVVDQTEPTTSNIIKSNRDDIALVRLAKPQATPIISMANSEPPVNARVETAGWGCTNKPLACTKFPSTLQASHQTVLRDRDCGSSVFWKPPMFAPTSICTTNAKSTVNHGDSGGPLLIPNGNGGFTQVGVTSLASDNTKKLDGAFTSIPVERSWINGAIRRLHRRGAILLFGTYSVNDGRATLASNLEGVGYKVTVADVLPVDLTPYGQVWWYGLNDLLPNQVTRLIAYARSGGRLYLSGEWRGCSCNNSSVKNIFNSLVVTVGGLKFGPDIAKGQDRPVVNTGAIDQAASSPNKLKSYLSSAIGTISETNIPSKHFLFTDNARHGTVGLWDNTNVVGGGRLVINMDLNWTDSIHGNLAQAGLMTANIAKFLSGPASP